MAQVLYCSFSYSVFDTTFATTQKYISLQYLVTVRGDMFVRYLLAVRATLTSGIVSAVSLSLVCVSAGVYALALHRFSPSASLSTV
jgi:hypothetical protein